MLEKLLTNQALRIENVYARKSNTKMILYIYNRKNTLTTQNQAIDKPAL